MSTREAREGDIPLSVEDVYDTTMELGTKCINLGSDPR